MTKPNQQAVFDIKSWYQFRFAMFTVERDMF